MSDYIELPPPQKELEFPLMRAIEQRRTKRRWDPVELSIQEISNLLWVACGVTVKETKRSKSRRTAPSACNTQEIQLYIALSYGLYRYEGNEHRLKEILSDDIRGDIGTQKMMKAAPVGLIYVSDFSRFKSFLFKEEKDKWLTAATDTGCISENVYLYAAATGLNTALLGLVNRERLQEIMGLGVHEKVIYTQSIGRALSK